MAIHYNGTTNFSTYSNSNIDATKQIAFSIWFNKDVTSNFDRLFHLHKTGTDGFMIAQDFDGGTTIKVFSSQATGNWGIDTAGRLQANVSNTVWNNICGTVSVTDGSGNKTLESAYLNGVAMTDTGGISGSPGTAQSDLFLAARTDTGSFFDGSLAEAAIWEDIEITAEEAAAIGAGAPVTAIQSQALVFYSPIEVNDGVDLITGNAGSATAATFEEHPPVTKVQLHQFIPVAAAPAAGRIMSSLANNGGLAGFGGIAGPGGGLAG